MLGYRGYVDLVVTISFGASLAFTSEILACEMGCCTSIVQSLDAGHPRIDRDPGRLKGVCLEQVPVIKDYWFDWRNYHPDTTVYGIRHPIQ